jgi:diaminohydroxyphosphoribosylaminopyrimidine deaminase / 5-amino-6-(5-phosphoribosylamino)uracil reductase
VYYLDKRIGPGCTALFSTYLSGDLSTVAACRLHFVVKARNSRDQRSPAVKNAGVRVTVKYAQSLDGRLATRSRGSQWITGPTARRAAHLLRAQHDAVLVGIGTVLADDPQLTVRLVPGNDPLRVVLDSRLRIPVTSKLLQHGACGTIVATSHRASHDRVEAIAAMGAEVVRLRDAVDGSQLDVIELLQWIGGRGLESLLVEGGAAVITTFFRLRLIDRLSVFVAPKVVGTGINAIGSLEIDHLSDAVTLHERSVQHLGSDILVSGRPQWPS